ncbi:MAG: LCP family protein [Clostridiales Family XIII bacterium]|nr:LCP family protein [Clostridiales Family XIII bacterium]
MRETRQERREREREEEYERERQQQRRKRNQRKKRKSRAGAYIAIIVVLVLAFTGLRIWLEARPGSAEPIVIAGADEFVAEGRVNILFLGTNQGLSDTMMVFSFDVEKKILDEISVPRDTYYARSAYPGAAYQKINSVLETEGYEGCARAVSAVLGGVPIHYYAEIDSEGVKKIVDSMGGVTMNVPIDMDYEDADQNLYIHLKAGPQTLGGDQAVQYLRFRSGYANADLGRVSAQQEFLKAAISGSAGLDFPKVALTAQGEVKTNMKFTAAMGLAGNAIGMGGGSFNAYTIPGTTGMQNGASYFFADAAGTKALMQQIYQQ